MLEWILVAIALTEAAWMAFDGARAFVVGDYVTPKTGKYAGQLGPWQLFTSAVGIGPRSGLMKGIFVAYGVGWLAIIGCYVAGAPWAWTAMLIAAIGSLWYLVIGTGCSVLVIILLVVSRT